jgi:alkylated DNA repair dioxygenase AlkB
MNNQPEILNQKRKRSDNKVQDHPSLLQYGFTTKLISNNKRQQTKVQKSNSAILYSNPSITHALSELGSRGFDFKANYITRDEERQLIMHLDHQTWHPEYSRRNQIYGHYSAEAEIKRPPRTDGDTRSAFNHRQKTSIPEFCFVLVQRLLKDQIYAANDPPKLLVANEYITNQGIGKHVDYLSAGPIIAGITLGHGCWMRFHELNCTFDPRQEMRSHCNKQYLSKLNNATVERTGRTWDVFIPSRSLYVMRDELRYAFQHEILRNKKDRIPTFRRISLLFRTSYHSSVTPSDSDIMSEFFGLTEIK